MIITKETEDALFIHLLSGSVSIPELQIALNVGYREARSIVIYAIKRNWLQDCLDDNRFPTSPTVISVKQRSAVISKKDVDALDMLQLRLMLYLGQNTPVRFEDILLNVTGNVDDAREAIDALTTSNMMIEHDDHYYCTISSSDFELIKKQKDKKDAEAEERRKSRAFNRRIFED